MTTKQRWAEYRVKAYWDRVKVGEENECWEWTGYKKQSPRNPTPYGLLGWKGKQCNTHRVAYELANGEIPVGKMILHKCDNTLCCNPSHLYLGDHAQNMRDMVERKRRKGKGSGTENGRAKLTMFQVREIRQIYAEGKCSQTILGKLYGVSQFAISAIVRNVRYKDEI